MNKKKRIKELEKRVERLELAVLDIRTIWDDIFDIKIDVLNLRTDLTNLGDLHEKTIVRVEQLGKLISDFLKEEEHEEKGTHQRA